MITERMLRQALLAIALAGLAFGLAASFSGKPVLAFAMWAAGTLPVIVALLVSMVRDLLTGRLGVDAVAFVSMSAALLLGEGLAAAVAFVSMSAALLLGEGLAAAVVAVMYAGGYMLEDYAVTRAERDLKSLVDRAPRIAHRRMDDTSRNACAAEWPLIPAPDDHEIKDHLEVLGRPRKSFCRALINC